MSVSELLGDCCDKSGISKPNSSEIAARLIKDAGIDGESVSLAALTKALEGKICQADDIAFMCNEVLNEYDSEQLTDFELCCAIAAIELYLVCVEKEAGSAEFVFWKAIRILANASSRVDLECAWHLMERLVSEG